ncbi:MAG: alpha-glucosidase [Dehalococcoidia bacterium]|nr:alpha-glucosidase [Dehalococcoidia bacterium]
MNKLALLFHGLRLAGLSNSLKALAYTKLKDRLDAKFLPPPTPSQPRAIGRLVSAASVPGGARFKFESSTLTARFLTPDFLFLGWDGAEMLPSYAVEKEEWTIINPLLGNRDGSWLLQSNALKLSVSPDGLLLFYDSKDQLIRREEPPLKLGSGWLHKATLPPEACVYGLGERAAKLNLRPGHYRLWNKDPGGGYGRGADPLYITMPLYLCLQEGTCFLAFYDNTCDGTVTLDGSAEMRFEGGPLRYYLAFGAPAETLKRYTELTGRAPLPPRWALGYQHSRWGFNSEEEMRRVFRGFRDNHLRLSALYMDIDYLDGYRVFTPDLERYPALHEFAATLEKTDTHLVGMTDPGVKLDPEWDIYMSGLAENAFCRDPEGNLLTGVVWPGWTVYPDFTDPYVREWWGSLYPRLLKHGISGLWHDMNEPAAFTASGDGSLPLCTRHNMDGEGGDHRRAHNVYGLLMDRAACEAWRKLKPDKRPFILSRSGWAGLQRYAWCWTGDIETSWQAVRQTVATVLGLGLSGLPYSGPDTGGFTKHPSTELYIRWFQLDSFLPVFRTHCAFYLPKREPWEFGSQALEILRAQLEMRHKLMPYWYTLAWKASRTGEPPVRPLFWDDPWNRDLWEVDDAFMCGDCFLVAPVMEKGALVRRVVPPTGEWFDYWSDEIYPGGAAVSLDAPLDRLPLLVKAGSIVPVSEMGMLILHVFHPGKSGKCSGILYSDEGDGYGPWRVDRFSLSETGVQGYELAWTSEGDYPLPYSEAKIVTHGFDGLEIKLKKL